MLGRFRMDAALALLEPAAEEFADLEAEPVRTIVQRLRRTGKLILKGDHAEQQPELFAENEGDANDAHHE